MTLAELEAACRALAGAHGLQWTWDVRFGAAVAVLSAADAPVVGATLAQTLPDGWTDETIGSATETARALGSTLGLRGGQTLRTLGDDALMLYCAWWPWNDGQRISIRVGWAVPEASPHQSALAGEFASWFGIGS